MAGSRASSVHLSKLSPGYLSGPPPPPLAITSGAGQDRDVDRKRKDCNPDGGSGGDRREKRRRSRWGDDENSKTFIPGMPTMLPTNLDSSQEQAYLLQLQIEDYTRRLRSGNLGIPSNPEQRSPSPEPIYGADGKRLNTREYRTRIRLENERHALIQKMLQMNAEYKPPAGYKPQSCRITDKILIPQEEHPEINFVGLLIGPRGNTLRALERESGAKIIIRGKGSVKEGKVGRKDGLPMPGEDEPLHALISSQNPDSVQRAAKSIKEIIRQGVEIPDSMNELRKSQLRELALLNGTLMEQDAQRCSNCGATGHKAWQCQDKPNLTNSIICTSCGSAGHLSRDCRQQRPSTTLTGGDQEPDPEDRARIDEEYLSLMAELGEGPPPRQPGTYGGGRTAGRAQTGGGPRWTAPPPPRPLLSQPPPAVTSQPPPRWPGPAGMQGPPPSLHQGPPPSLGQGPPPSLGQGPPPSLGQGPPPSVHQGPPPNLGQGPPPSLGQGPPPSVHQGPPPNLGQGPPPSLGQGPRPSLGQGPPPSLGQGQPPSLGQGPRPSLGQGPSPGLGQGPPPSLGQGPPPSLGQGPPPSVRQGPPPAVHQGPPPAVHQGPPPAVHHGPPPALPQGPPPTSAPRPDFSAPPAAALYRAPPSAAGTQPNGAAAGHTQSSGPDTATGGDWRSPWPPQSQQSPAHPQPQPTRAGSVPGPRPLGLTPSIGLPPWQPQFGAPASLHQQRQYRGQSDPGAAGLPDLLAAPPSF